MSSSEHTSALRQLEEVGSGGGGVDNSKKIAAGMVSRSRTILKSLDSLRNSDKVVDIFSGLKYQILHQRLHQIASHPLSSLQVPEYHRFDSAYWDIPYEKKHGAVFNTQVSPHLEVWSGMLASFDHGLRALVVDMAMRIYASELIETQQIAESMAEQQGLKPESKKYNAQVSKTKAELEAQLLLAMCHSFRPDYVLAIAFAMPNGPAGPRHLVGSIGGARGRTERQLQETVGWDGSNLNTDQEKILSSLPTNTALTYQLNEAGQAIATAKENEVVEITRLNVAPKATCQQLGITERGQLSQTLMYIIHFAIQHHMPGVVWEIFNTQMPLHRMMKQMGFPVEVISQPDTLQPTPLVAESIHGHYFRRTPPTPQMIRVDTAARVAKQHFGQRKEERQLRS